jgi:hypothetical protein
MCVKLPECLSDASSPFELGHFEMYAGVPDIHCHLHCWAYTVEKAKMRYLVIWRRTRSFGRREVRIERKGVESEVRCHQYGGSEVPLVEQKITRGSP